MNNVTVINTITPRTKLLVKLINKDLIEAVAGSLNKIRLRAFYKYMIANNQGRERRLRYLLKSQPTHPTKLTSRTRALEKMLLDIGSWRFGFRTARSSSDAMLGAVKTIGKDSENVVVEGTLSARILSTSKYSSSKTITKQKLMGRFMWDRPSGVRGKRRPNLTAAMIDELPLLEQAIIRRMRSWK